MTNPWSSSATLFPILNFNSLHQQQQQQPHIPHYNNTLNETQCPKWFFSLKMVNELRNFPGQCPDVLSVPIMAGLWLGFYLILVVSSIIGFVWKRKSDHIRARTTAGMFFTLVSSFFVFTIFSTRYIVGREIFPCVLFSLVFFIMPPCFSIPTIIRCLRAYVQWRFNLLKESKFRENNENEQFHSTEEQNNDTVTTISTAYSSPNSPNNLIPVMTYRSPILKTLGNKIASHQNLKRIEKFFIYSNYILQSHKWLISMFIVIYGFHIILWFSIALLEDSFFADSRFIMEDESMLSAFGCYPLAAISYIGGTTYAVYLILELICLILLLRTEKDTYFIKGETIFILILQVICVGFYIALGQSFYRVVDHIAPAGMVMFLYLSLEIIVTVTLPVIYSILKEYRKVEVFDSELEWALNKSETCEMLLEYARRSFCPEGVLVYKDISKFKLASTFKKRKTLAMQVVDNYLTFGGVYELNLPNIHVLREDILFRINRATSEEELPDDMFHAVQVQTLMNLKDVFERLRRSNERMRKLLEEWRQMQQPETLPSSPQSPTPLLNQTISN